MALNRMHYGGKAAVSSGAISFCGCPMHALTMAETLSVIEQAIVDRRMLQHVAVNVAKLVQLQSDAELRRDVIQSDLVSIDGTGVVWGARLAGHNVPERVTGIDLMQALLARCAERGYRPYFLGAEPAVLDEAVRRLCDQYPGLQIAGAHHGYFSEEEEADVMSAIADTHADCLFIAISSPRKERLLAAYKERLGVPFLMGVGGSLDVVAGKVRRAPTWMQRFRLEWLFRSLQEPRRMWRRYLVTNTLYAGLLLREIVFRRAPRATA